MHGRRGLPSLKLHLLGKLEQHHAIEPIGLGALHGRFRKVRTRSRVRHHHPQLGSIESQRQIEPIYPRRLQHHPNHRSGSSLLQMPHQRRVGCRVIVEPLPLYDSFAIPIGHIQALCTHIDANVKSIHSFILFDNVDPASRPCTVARQPCRRRLRFAGLGYSTVFAKRAGSHSHPQARSFRGECGFIPDRSSILRPARSRYKGRHPAEWRPSPGLRPPSPRKRGEGPIPSPSSGTARG